MDRQQTLNRIRDHLVKLAFQLQVDNKSLHFDLNRISEDILLPVFRIAYRLPNLVNLNAEEPNSDAIDLGDKDARTAFQITSRRTNAKILKTLNSIKTGEHFRTYDIFYVFSIVPVQDKLSVKGWKKATGGSYKFEAANVHDITNLQAKISSLEIDEISRIETILAKNLGEGEKYSLRSLKKACTKVSDSTIRLILDSRTVVPRPNFHQQFSQFIDSSVRYSFLTGPSSVGKSTVLALEARAAIGKGLTTVFVSLPYYPDFSLAAIANEIRIGMLLREGEFEWHNLIGSWDMLTTESDDEEHTEPERLLIIVDGIEYADTEVIAKHLAELNRSLARTSPRLVKVLLSCRESEFEKILKHKHLPFYLRVSDLKGDSLSDSRTIDIGDFDNRELDVALSAIGADDLIREVGHDGKLDDHVVSMRTLLKHPGTFEHFAALYALGEITTVSDETWSTLIGKRFDQCFREVEQLTGRKAEEIIPMLLHFVEYCREHKIRDFSVSLSSAKAICPGLFETNVTGLSLHNALVSCGVFSPGDPVAFRVTDAGGFLLSIRLEEELRSAGIEEQVSIVSGWLDEKSGYWPIADGILTLIDRLATDKPRPTALLAILLDAIAFRHRESSWFKVMKPSVLEYLFQKVREVDPDRTFYEYRTAARQVRYSARNDELLKRHLSDLSPHARELAVELIGQYKLVSFCAALIERLADEEREVRQAALKAFGLIGPAGIEVLLDALGDDTRSETLRSSVAWALLNIGHLNEAVSKAISVEFPRARQRKLETLTKNLVFLSAHLRDRSQVEVITEILAGLGQNDEAIRAVAKYFANVPEGQVFDKFENLLVSMEESADELDRRWNAASVINTLVRLDRDRAASLLLSKKDSYLIDQPRNVFSDTRDLVFQNDIHELYPTLYDAATTMVRTLEIKWGGISLLDDLGNVWSPEGVEALATSKSARSGSASLFIDALYPHMGDDEYDYGDRLNQIKHLKPAIKAQDQSFPSEALRLLPKASPFGIEKLGNLYWILGETEYEGPLLDNFKLVLEKTAELSDGRKIIEVSGAALPLGTCGVQASTEFLLSFLRGEPDDVSISFGEQTLLPLVLRGVCSVEQLSEIAADEKINRIGRAVCIEVIRDFDAPGNVDLFAKIVDQSTDELVLMNAVFGLGVSESNLAIEPLRKLLGRSEVSPTLKGYIARSLMVGLEAQIALPDIQDAFTRLERYDDMSVRLFTTAFISSGDISCLNTLQNFGTMSTETRRYISEATISLAIDTIDKREFARTLGETSERPHHFFQEQSYLLKGILRKPRNELLEVIAEDLDKNRLNPGSQEALISNLRSLAANDGIDKGLVVRIAAGLITHRDHELRYRALPVLGFLDKNICHQIFEQCLGLRGADERTVACGVESLGYWDCDEMLLRSQRFDARQFVREAVDLALKQRAKRAMLEYHLEIFQNGSGMKRLASYLCLCDNGDRHTIRRLRKLSEGHTIHGIQSAHVMNCIQDRLERERTKFRTDMEKRYEERGVIRFG